MPTFCLKIKYSYLESDVETFLLMESDIPLVRSAGKFALSHAEGQNNFRSLGHLWSGTLKMR